MRSRGGVDKAAPALHSRKPQRRIASLPPSYDELKKQFFDRQDRLSSKAD
jgi:hypothetical protein